MSWLLELRNFAYRFRFALTDAGRQVRQESVQAFVSAFDELKGDAESFASGVKAYSSAPPALLSALRRVRPARVWKSQLARTPPPGPGPIGVSSPRGT